jgi:hypothetical protein
MAHRRAVMVASPAGAVTEAPVGGPARGRWRSGPGGSDAGCAFVRVYTSSASGRRPVSGADVQPPRMSVRATGVQSPVRASERPGVRRPVSAVGVRCPCAPASAVSDQGEVVEGGGGAGSRVAGIGVPARRVHDRLLVTPGIEAAQAALGQGRRRGLDSAVVVGGGGAVTGRPRSRPG